MCVFVCYHTCSDIQESLKRGRDLLELDLQAVVCDMGAGNGTLVLWKSRKCS